MKTQSIIETTGNITKMEVLSNVEYDILPGSLVLTNKKPFPGFKQEQQPDELKKPLQSYYLVLMYRYFPEKLERIAKALNNESIIECCSSIGEIILQNNIFPCIRIKRLKADRILIDIQEFYKKNDIKFLAYKKINAEAKIKVFKHFRIIEIEEGIYRDLSEGEKFYINIPIQLNWKLFDYFIKRVKSNLNNSNFDAALGVINRFTGPEDVIRIYDHDKTLERALEIKRYFYKEFKKEKMLLNNISNINSAVYL
ncbi:MAG: hypothetical protein JXB00_11075 [Bacteroidales bacterium]|nr:hypothetical protein [Bacteroidales bacterium]